MRVIMIERNGRAGHLGNKAACHGKLPKAAKGLTDANIGAGMWQGGNAHGRKVLDRHIVHRKNSFLCGEKRTGHDCGGPDLGGCLAKSIATGACETVEIGIADFACDHRHRAGRCRQKLRGTVQARASHGFGHSFTSHGRKNAVKMKARQGSDIGKTIQRQIP